MTIGGVCYTIYPPTKISWNYGVKIKAAMRNDDIFREAASFIATPTILIGICFIIFSFLPFVIKNTEAFQWRPAMMFMFLASLTLLIKIQHHLKKTFDEEGNRKDPL